MSTLSQTQKWTVADLMNYIHNQLLLTYATTRMSTEPKVQNENDDFRYNIGDCSFENKSEQIISHLEASCVILPSFVWIRQDIIGECDLLKHISCFRVICILVRMVPAMVHC